jgi:uncharacterized protein YciI
MLFVYFMQDAPDMATRRAELRPSHQQYLAGEADRFFAAGPLWSDDGAAMNGSIFIMEWPNRAAAARWLENEPFTANGVYGYINIKGYRNLWPKSGRPAVKNKLFAYFNLNGETAAAPRKAYRQAHLDYLAATEDHLFAAGPMFNDSDATDMEDRVGSLYIVDFADRAAADAWLAAEPFNANGVYGDQWAQAYENLWPKNKTS